MQHKVRIEKTVDAKYLKVRIDISGEDLPNDIPFRFGDRWEVIIDLDSGSVMNWHYPSRVHVSVKVVDSGTYWIYDQDLQLIKRLGETCSPKYVPNRLLPPEDGYGDYLDLDIDEEGKILNWYETPSLADFFE